MPRLRVRPGEDQGGQVASFSEGVVLVRRDAFREAGATTLTVIPMAMDAPGRVALVEKFRNLV